MTSEVSWDKLPSSFFGLFLIIHLVIFSGYFYFWLNNLSNNCSLPSDFFLASIIGIIIGAVMFYHVDPYYNDIKKKKTFYDEFWHQPFADHKIPRPEKPTEPKVSYKVCVIVVLAIYVLFLLFLLGQSHIPLKFFPHASWLG